MCFLGTMPRSLRTLLSLEEVSSCGYVTRVTGRDFSINELLFHKRPAAANFDGYQQNLYEFKNFLERKVIREFETELKHCAFFLDEACGSADKLELISVGRREAIFEPRTLVFSRIQSRGLFSFF